MHRDVKPGNVLVTGDGVVKVTDFGLARALRAPAGASVQMTPAQMTPQYCSPEQARHAEPLTVATDVWSWAISVWAMYAGATPVRAGQIAAQAFAAYRAEPWRDDKAIPAMPEPLAALLARCLDPDPQTPPRDLGALADELAAMYP